MHRFFAAASLAAVAGTGHATITIDFSGFAHGEILTNQLDPFGVSISAVNFNGPDIAAVFDTQSMGGPDPDLQGPPWNGGNLAVSSTETVLGGAVIIAENGTDNNNDGILDSPDDEAGNPAGTLTFTLNFLATALGFDVIDIEGVVKETSSVDFYRNGGLVLSVGFSDFIDSNSAYYDPTIVFGNNSANRISPIEVAGGFDQYVINIGGSSAYDTFVIIPAPATGALALTGLLLAGKRRR